MLFRSPSAESVEMLKRIVRNVLVPAGTQQLNDEQHDAVKEFICQLPVSKGLDTMSLYILERIVASQYAAGEAPTTVNWQMLAERWTEICTTRNRTHLVHGLLLLLERCFETSNTRIIGLLEMQWDAEHRQIIITPNRLNFHRLADFLKEKFETQPEQQAEQQPHQPA